MESRERAFRILELTPGATRDDVRRAYRDLAMVWHPDRFPEHSRLRQKAENRLKEINEAYALLGRGDMAHARAASNDTTSTATARGPEPGANRARQRRRDAPPYVRPRWKDPATRVPRARRGVPGWIYLMGAAIIVFAMGEWLKTQAWEQDRSEGATLRTTSIAAEPVATGGPRPRAERPILVSVSTPTRVEASESAGEHRAGPGAAARLTQRAGTGWFTVGSTRDEVRAIQGTPASASPRVWKYGSSSVFFSGDRVTGWDIWRGAPLRARMLPASPVPAGPGYFTVGSSKDEVLAVQGTPTAFERGVWKFGESSVYFKRDRVARWTIWPGSPLAARLLPAGQPAGDFEHFTVGSSRDEVLAAQGTPTTLDDRVWKFGSSSVHFKGDRVSHWDEWPGSPLNARDMQ